MQYNWKAFKAGDEQGKKYFNHPGYEEKVTLDTHDLNQLVDITAIEKRLDAIPRIKKNNKLDYRSSLADLEHSDQLLVQKVYCLNNSSVHQSNLEIIYQN